MKTSDCSRFSLLLLTAMLLPAVAHATAPVSVAIMSHDTTITILLHHEDASDISKVRTGVYMMLPGLAILFREMQKEGLLCQRFPRLVIEAQKQFTVNSRLEHQPAIVTFSPEVQLVCNNPDTRQFEPVNLGPAYVLKISTGLVSYKDLLALMAQLPNINRELHKLEIGKEEMLHPADTSAVFKQLWNKKTVWQDTLDKSGSHSLQHTLFQGRMLSVPKGFEQTSGPLPIETLTLVSPPAYLNLEQPNGGEAFLGWASMREAVLFDFQTGQYFKTPIEISPDAVVHGIHFFHLQHKNSLIALVRETFGQTTLILAFNLKNREWNRLYPYLPSFALTDSVFFWQNEGTLIPFRQATPVTTVRNATTLLQEPIPGQGPHAHQMTFSGRLIIVFSLTIVVFLVLWLVRKRASAKAAISTKD